MGYMKVVCTFKEGKKRLKIILNYMYRVELRSGYKENNGDRSKFKASGPLKEFIISV